MYNVSLEDVLDVLYDWAPAKVDALSRNKRSVEYGQLSVGLKIHDLGQVLQPLLERLGSRYHVTNHYRHEKANLCMVLPPLGSARTAVSLLECIDLVVGGRLFRNPLVQIQVCSPGKLRSVSTALLGAGRYIGSDYFPRYNADDFATTFTETPWGFGGIGYAYPRGKRMIIYDAEGDFDPNFEYWATGSLGLEVYPNLPFCERTDVLDCKTPLDIYNVNRIATLLVHRTHGGYWFELGEYFVEEMTAILRRHHLGEVLIAPWVSGPESPPDDDLRFAEALREVIGCVFDDAVRLAKGGSPEGGILYQTKALLQKYHNLVLKYGQATRMGDDQ